jgi:putative NADH-flavin reductase
MRIVILGATGLTGQQLLRQAVERQHQVTVLVRDPGKLGTTHKVLNVITGDVLDEGALSRALEGNEAVLVALGKGKSLRSSNLMTGAVTNIVSGMKARNMNRVVFLSAFGVGETFQQANFIQRIIFRTLLKNIYSDKAKADQMLRDSTLGWTLVHPVLLTNKPGTGNYRAGEILSMKGMPKISRADVAEFILDQLDDNKYLKKTVVLG